MRRQRAGEAGGLHLASVHTRAYMVRMQDFFGKPVRAAAAVTLIVAAVGDAANGAQDLDYKGPTRILEVASSAPSTAPMFVQVENTIIGPSYEVIPSEGQHAGELAPLPRLIPSLDHLLTRVTDVSGGQLILHNWVPYQTGRRWS